MYRKNYIGHHGFNTYVRGVWTTDENGDRAVRITATGREDDEIAVGQVLSLEELNAVTEGDVYAYAGRAAEYAVA
jgi:hypothetical protein